MAAAGTAGSDDDAGGRAGEEAGGGWVREITRLCRGTAAPQFLLLAALLEAGSGVAHASRFPREAGNSGLDGKSLRRDERKKAFLVRGQCWQRLGAGEGLCLEGVRGWLVPRLPEQGGGQQDRLEGSGQTKKGSGPRASSSQVGAFLEMSSLGPGEFCTWCLRPSVTPAACLALMRVWASGLLAGGQVPVRTASYFGWC